MASLNILYSEPHNFLKEVVKKLGKYIRKFLWPIKNSKKYFMDHQCLPKIFHGPCKNPLPPSYILNVRSLKLIMHKQKNLLVEPLQGKCSMISICHFVIQVNNVYFLNIDADFNYSFLTWSRYCQNSHKGGYFYDPAVPCNNSSNQHRDVRLLDTRLV